MTDGKQTARQKGVRKEDKAVEEAAPVAEAVEDAPVLSVEEFLTYVRDELVPAARSLGYAVTLTELAKSVGPTMYYDPDTLEGVVYQPGEEVPKRMLTGDQWAVEAQRRLKE